MGKRRSSESKVTVRAREAVDAVSDIIRCRDLDDPQSKMFVYGATAEYTRLHGLEGAGIRQPSSGDVTRDLQRVVDARCSSVEGASIFILDPEALDVTVAAANAVTERDVMGLSIDDMPSARGFLMLPRNLYLNSRATVTETVDIRAFSWSVGDCFDGGQWRRDVRFNVWTQTDGGVGDTSYTMMIEMMRSDGVWLPKLIHASHAFVPKVEWEQQGVGADDFNPDQADSEFSRYLDSAERTMGAPLQQAGFALDDTAEPYVSGGAIPDLRGTFSVRFMFAFARLCAQDSGFDVAEVRDRVPGLRERRERPEDSVLVTSLHPRRAVGGGERSGPVSWSSRWVVKMHARRQWYPSKGRHEVIFVGPYVKGPEGKPMKERGSGPSVTVVRR